MHILGPMTTQQAKYEPGQRVRITQQIPRQSGALTSTFEGTILNYEQQKTGSWFAHSKDHKVWVERVELQKADGERVFVNLDQYTSVEFVTN